jgi:hypothetical protein
MKVPRTALALAGWSLLLPPASHTLRLDLTSDLSKWAVHSTHKTEAECAHEKKRLEATMADPVTNAPKSTLRRPGRELLKARYRNARCVSSKDPAFKSQQ